jgi:hypothetical protein
VNDEITCVVMQPTYLPWLGYFDLMDQCSVFVFLDNVLFSRQSWQQRNRIKTSRGLEWLTVPVRNKGIHGQYICDVEIIRSPAFPKDHIRGIELNYGRSRYFSDLFPSLREVLNQSEKSLCRLNVALITWAAKILGIETTLVTASELGVTGERSHLLVDLCKQVDAGKYLSPFGSMAYLSQEHGIFAEHGVKLLVHHYEHPEYTQLFNPFIPYASVIDLLFNEGEHSLEIIRSGRKNSFSIEEALSRSGNAPSQGE